MRKLFLAAALAASASTPAFAQESAPFSGLHVEGLAGYDILKTPDARLNQGADGLLFGANLGYDFQIGGVVLGPEGEITGATSNQRGSNLLAVGDSTRLKTDRDLYIGARLGLAATPTTLIYAKGGYTNARIKARYNNGTGSILEDGVTLDGYRLGAGIEQKFGLLGPRGFAKAEYRYSNYRNLDFGAANIATDLDRHQLLAGVGVRF